MNEAIKHVVIDRYKANRMPPTSVLKVAEALSLPYFKVISILKENGIEPHIPKLGKSADSQYLVDYYYLKDCTLADLAIAFDYANSSNIHRVIKNNPYYERTIKKRKSSRDKSKLVDLMWQPDIKAYEAYLKIKDIYPTSKAWIGVNQAIKEYIEEGYIPVKSYNFNEKVTTLSLKPEVNSALIKYSNFFDTSKNQIVNCALKNYLQNDNISYN